MKKIIILCIGAILLLGSCRKKKPKVCDVSVTAIAGNYKISKIETVIAGVTRDVTNDLLDIVCERDDIYQLKADKTAVYLDAGTACSPSGAKTGTWDVVAGAFTVTLAGDAVISGTVVNNCNNLVTEELFTGGIIRTTLTRQ
jgi:hypothetical protein